SARVLWAWRWFGGAAGRRHAAAWAVAGGFFTAYALLSWAPLRPSAHWEWLPYLGVVAAVLGPVGLVDGIRWPERWAVWLVAALLAAWFLVPDWSEIEPHRPAYLAILTGLLFLTTVLFDALADRVDGRLFAAVLGVTAIAGAVVLAESGTMKFAQLAGVLAAALAGSVLAMLCGATAVRFRGAVPAVVLLLGGLMFAGYVNSFSSVPAASYLLVAIAPLPLGICRFGPLASLPRRVGIAAQLLVVLVPIVVAVALASTAEPAW
ncbi:MAG: hypothetical protein ACREJB_11290, partial [Planctomycetaceae bacterium]